MHSEQFAVKTSSTQRRLEGKIAIITGASRGIGAAAARLFASEGASVVLASRSEQEMTHIVEEIRSVGGNALAVPTDVSSAASLEELVRQTVETYGRLDIAFNNAGIGMHKPFIEYTEEEFDRVLSVNLKGVFLAMKYEIIAMLEAGGGAIVNTSSVGGLVAGPGLAPYSASKHGVIGLTKGAAGEYGKHNIRVNAIAPGSTLTDMMARWIALEPGIEQQLIHATPLGRMSNPAEVAEAALWLSSDSASYVTGATLLVDGGALAR
ncbi:2,5-dichloro-2,5-cyclohexadiene-1,4-diol dehydrogenase [Reticulibacter mediterranei]|uniref:2,5-dichloro-2,5-cyclohexadiene-1,4-diol dehydrogenase n=1 Tax=Reticulibacter mediterranei TaxID=2778369 RepID=A0A8J3IDV1_9CHLR|nr:glucose 1-dehydrogenase [Reticulibacter mediterranei]GHO93569.1 2,5-dichloro-2,5-cyclohexadiene-1,4-diol dehydrogenase [Reticulibacter mediterranei]